MAAFFVLLLTASLSDGIKARGPIMAVGTLVALCGYIMILASKSNGVRYGGTFLVATGVYPGSAMIIVSLKLVYHRFDERSLTWLGLAFEQFGTSLRSCHWCGTPHWLSKYGCFSGNIHLSAKECVSYRMASETTSDIDHLVSSPDYILGHSVCIGSLILCFATVCIQMLYCRWENMKREKGDRDSRLIGDRVHLLGHRHPAYRYTL